jgi:hypothetical protein
MSDERLQKARDAVDRAMAAKPHLDGHALTDATTAVCAYRDDLRRALREGKDPTVRERLDAANLIVNLLLAGHYPLGETPWEQMEAIRGLLDRLDAREPA